MDTLLFREPIVPSELARAIIVVTAVHETSNVLCNNS